MTTGEGNTTLEEYVADRLSERELIGAGRLAELAAIVAERVEEGVVPMLFVCTTARRALPALAASQTAPTPHDELPVWRALIERFDRQEALVTEHYQPRWFGLAETALLVEEVVHGLTRSWRATPGSWSPTS
jgi:hypothetical protein